MNAYEQWRKDYEAEKARHNRAMERIDWLYRIFILVAVTLLVAGLLS